MQLRSIQVGEAIGAQRGEAVVCIPVYKGHEYFVECLSSVLEHTAADVRILICDDASPDRRSEQHVGQLAERSPAGHDVYYMAREHNVGFPANVNGAFAAAVPADVVILNSDCVVAEGWLEGLREAAYLDEAVATATALTNHGTIVSVPEGAPARSLPEGWTLDAAAAAVRARSLRLRPSLPTAVGHCVYVRRSALELVGDFDLAFSPGYGEEVDFSQRCLAHGLRHVAADDVLVLHHAGASFAVDGVPAPVQAEHEQLIARRYPYYHEAVRAIERDRSGQLARALGAARRTLTGIRVVLDARGPGEADEQARALMAALARTGEAQVELLTGTDRVEHDPGWVDVVHRLSAIGDVDDLSLAARSGARLVLTYGDLTGYRNPSYFESPGAWERHRRLTAAALAAADRLTLPSEHARAAAVREGLLDARRTSAIAPGVDWHAGGDAVAPPRAERLEAGRELLLVLGSDRSHRNRPFALRILQQLQRERGWPGLLVLAGDHVRDGSSAAHERALLAGDERLAEATIDLGAVGGAQQRWLLARAALVIDPAVGEAFESLPFAAAEHGVPCLWPRGAWLDEFVQSHGAIVGWDVEHSATRALELIADRDARARNVAALRDASAKLTWEACAARLLELYRAVCEEPASPSVMLKPPPPPPPPPLSDDAMRLVGPGGALPPELERPLLALATHRALARPIFGALKAGYRLANRRRSDR